MGKLLTSDICRTLLSNMRKLEEAGMPVSIREGYFRQALEKALPVCIAEEAEAKKSDSALKNPAKK